MSSITFDMLPATPVPAIIVLRVIFLSPPPEVSMAKRTSSSAAVPISDKEVIKVGLKFVPSAISKAP